MKHINAQQHARIVLESHTINHEPRYREYRTFAKPGETQADAIKRFNSTRKRYLRTPPARVFPRTAEALANTKAYVEAFYALNHRDETNGHDGLVAGYVRDLFGELSTANTTWPETDEVLAEIVD